MMSNPQPNNPLHGITLETIITKLVEQYGWAELGKRIPIKCFNENPSIKSSLKLKIYICSLLQNDSTPYDNHKRAIVAKVNALR
jgi:hypothetical protein